MEKMKIHKVMRQVAITLLGFFAFTGLSCERDTFYVGDDIKPGEPCNVILGFELPQKDQVTITRTLTDKDEHSISDFYLLIFDEMGNRIFGKYYYHEELQEKRDYLGGEWQSLEVEDGEGNVTLDEDANSTHGYVVAKALTSGVYIFGFANIGDSEDETVTSNAKLEGTAVKDMFYEGLTSTRYKLDNITTLDELYKVQMDAMSSAKDNILNRIYPNLLFSGSFRRYDHNTLDLNQSTSGYLDLGAISKDPRYVDDKGNIDLRNLGMIYLRRLTAHVTFNITVNKDVFSDFEPETWEVVNLPTRVYLMDQGADTPELHAEIEFKSSTKMEHVIHDNGMYSFDFWMFENHKKSRNASSNDLRNSLNYAVAGSGYVNDANIGNSEYAGQYLDDATEIEKTGANYGRGIMDYYVVNYGDKLTDWGTDNNPLPKLKTVYGYGSWNAAGRHENYGFDATDDADKVNREAKAQFLYAKREYQVKRKGIHNEGIWNREGDYYPNADYCDENQSLDAAFADASKKAYMQMGYSSKKFVYAEDKATYVVIRGRLMLNSDEGSIKLRNYGLAKDEDGYLTSEVDEYKSGYVNVEYTIHLGNINEQQNGSIDDFNVLRNTEYNYTVTINGINSIYTSVVSNIQTPGEATEEYHVRKQPGANGMINLAMNHIYNTDAHFCQFNMMLTKAELDNFYFEMHTPWNIFSSHDFYKEFEDWDANRDGIRDATPTKRRAFIDIGGYIPSSMELDPYLVGKHRDVNMNLVWDYTLEDIQRVNEMRINPDFTWFKFSPTIDQRGMTEDMNTFGNKEETYRHTRPTVKYDRNSWILWNLYEFTSQMEMIVIERNKVRAWRPGTDFSKADLDAYDSAHPDDPLTTFECYLSSEQTLEKIHILDNRINRMFYTVYLDEYYYHTLPYGVTSWEPPYWKHFANQPSRFVNFGYHVTGEEEVKDGYMLSADKQSGVMLTQFTVVQPSIQTFYSTESMIDDDSHVAIGVEHNNETHDPRWTDQGAGGAISTTEASPGVPLKSYNGWENTIYYVDQANIWENYVDDVTYDDVNGLQNNVAMRRSSLTPDSISRSSLSNLGDIDVDNPYLAGAIRVCLNRNRDENGNGRIDEEELKWFLPTSRQYELAGLCHYSLQDPLFDYNKFVISGDNQRLPEKSVHGDHLARYHFAASDYTTLTSEEMMNSPGYNVKQNYQTRPYEMRCMRNLGGEEYQYTSDESGHKRGDSKENAEGKIISKRTQSLMYTYDEDTKVFEMKLFDTRSLRGIYYDAHELPPHYLFSKTNLPYKKFKVAKNLQTVNTSGISTFRQVFENLKPCQSYTEDGGKDLGSWRAPNHAELGIMVLYLRQLNSDHPNDPTYFGDNNNGQKVVEVKSTYKNGPWFFSADTNHPPYSCTSWNFTGFWGRVHGTNYSGNDEGWGITTSSSTSSNDLNIDNNNHFIVFGDSPVRNMSVRCVKDVYD